jgi:hypothetical protein
MISRFSLALSLIIIPFLISGCLTSSDSTEPAGNTKNDEFAPTARAFEFEDWKAACQSTSECILMRVGGCDNVRAVHQSQIGPANEYSEYVKKMSPHVVCAPDLPMEEYEPLCLNRQCKEVARSFRFLLEVPEQPVVGQPFWIGMSFRFPVDAEQVDAKFFLPDNVRVIQGKETWSGSVRAHEDHVMWVQVQTNTTGEVYLSGWAGIKDGNFAISPLGWGKHFTILQESLPTPQPEYERILATPTPIH